MRNHRGCVDGSRICNGSGEIAHTRGNRIAVDRQVRNSPFADPSARTNRLPQSAKLQIARRPAQWKRPKKKNRPGKRPRKRLSQNLPALLRCKRQCEPRVARGVKEFDLQGMLTLGQAQGCRESLDRFPNFPVPQDKLTVDVQTRAASGPQSDIIFAAKRFDFRFGDECEMLRGDARRRRRRRRDRRR